LQNIEKELGNSGAFFYHVNVGDVRGRIRKTTDLKQNSKKQNMLPLTWSGNMTSVNVVSFDFVFKRFNLFSDVNITAVDMVKPNCVTFNAGHRCWLALWSRL
jgi:hypothetical protein